ncbi:MAG: fumarylacetoacetate hydrolase family protein, partial [Burkholderiales bacterium]
TCRRVPKNKVFNVIAGYTVLNDVTIRDWQLATPTMTMGKSWDSHCPMGPVLVTADEVGPLGKLRVCTEVNGELRQDALVRDLIFDVPTLIRTLSEVVTLMPGDIIATGTPAGVGIGFDPPRFLKTGDLVGITIDRLGKLENPVA